MKKVLSQIGNNKEIIPKATTKKNCSYNQQKIKAKNFTHFPTTGDNNDQLSNEKKINLELGTRMLTEESQNVKRNILKNSCKANNKNTKNQLSISSKNFKKKILNINTSSNNSGDNASSVSKNRSGSEKNKEKDNNSKDKVVIHKYKTNAFKSKTKGDMLIKNKDNENDKDIKENGHIKKVSINLNENCNKMNSIQNKKREYNGYDLNINSDCNPNNYNAKVQKVKNDAPAPSQVFSSISTFNTLVNINSKERKNIPSSSQIKELNDLNKNLQYIQNTNINMGISNNNYPQFNIINAEMLEKDSISVKIPQDKEISSLTKEMATCSNQRLQTYQLLLNCINTKFNEIQEIVDNDMGNKQYADNNNNNNRDTKVSELHSKIDFTQEQINLVQNSDDYIDEMQEKSHLIIPKGVNPNMTDNITINFLQNIAKKKSIETSNFDFTTEFNNSDIIGKTKGECDDKNLISFLSNEMISFFQPSFFLERAETFTNKIPKGSVNKIQIRSTEGLPPVNTINNNIAKITHYADTQDSIIDQNEEYDDEDETKKRAHVEDKLKEGLQQMASPKNAARSSDKCTIF